jgi:hypothetical protein
LNSTRASFNFNPQVEEWSPELVALEAAAKDRARCLVFVVDNQTRSLASMLEVGGHMADTWLTHMVDTYG